MDNIRKDLSLHFYDYLCHVIGTEEVGKMRRQIFSWVDCVRDHDESFKFVISGSKAEGLDLKESDFDEMQVLKNYRVYENVDKIQDLTSAIPILMDNESTKPGFTKLVKYDYHYGNDSILNKTLQNEQNASYISSKLFRDLFSTEYTITHGPCQSDINGKLDFARCFKCCEWINPARQWIGRSRTQWPDECVIDSILLNGVHFVPIGNADSLNKDNEWRISFSLAEKLLVYSFCHTQFFCYALLKILLIDIIKKKHGDLLCSYFVKTVMFWISEESDQLIWKPENILSCFNECLRRLLYSVEYNTCLHYFIPENNFFENRFRKQQQIELLSTMRFLYKQGWCCLLCTDTLQGFVKLSSLPPDTVPRVSAVPFFFYVNAEYISSGINSISILKWIAHDKCQELSATNVCAYLLSLRHQTIAHSRMCMVDKNKRNNKYNYKRYRKCMFHLLLGVHHDVAAGWLLLASFFYTCKQYRECIHIIIQCLSECDASKILLKLRVELKSQNAFEKLRMTYMNQCLLAACRYAIINDVYMTESSHLLPAELKCTVKELEYFPPHLFGHLLLFLCFHHLEDFTGKGYALRDLEIIIRKGYYITNNQVQRLLCSLCFDVVKQMYKQ
ncbi:uncharacterized protein LOC127724006 [Mytilus californianus]|uniref:uncharacterized protein LOC127724006 n=1 Tax=Mytilus californianus TaxID=6549 RepID=UPI002245DD03|nr:uncharacterized protein LOC127724006 [Mytilus californianus]